MDSRNAPASGWTSPPAIVACAYMATYVVYGLDARHDPWLVTRAAHGALSGIAAALVLLGGWNLASYWPGRARGLAEAFIAAIPLLPFLFVSRGLSVPALVVGLAALLLHAWYNRRIYEYLDSVRPGPARRPEGSFVLFAILAMGLAALGGLGAWLIIEIPWEHPAAR